MDVKIISTEIVKPSSPTPHHLRNFKPSFLDQISAPFYIPLTLFYDTKFDTLGMLEIHCNLKKSLSETLKLFYPLAGRVQDMFNIVCNDEGVSYTEAIVSCTLSEYLQKPDLNTLNKFLPQKTNALEDALDFQVSIQVSTFSCGGLVIGVCMFHRIVDIATMGAFLKTWAGFSGPMGELQVKLHDLELGSSLFPPLSSLPEDYLSNKKRHYFSDGRSYHLTRRFVFDASAIAALRIKGASVAVPNPSRVEALTAFISERLRAGLEKSPSKQAAILITHAVNIRNRTQPPLPAAAFGNFTWFAVAYYNPSEEVELPDYVERMRESLDGMNDESLKELEPETAITLLNESIGTMNGSKGRIRIYRFSSWSNMGFYDLDFGRGRPVWVAHMGDAGESRTKHQFMLLEGRKGGEIELWMLFGEEEISMLENDEEFVAFATPNPSVII